MNKTKDYHAVSLSGGKDSTAMLLMMLEHGMPIDAVLYADTGMEFPEMYDHLSKVDALLYQERGIHITVLRHPRGFEYLMFDGQRRGQALWNAARNWAFRPMAMAGLAFGSGGVPDSLKHT